MATRSKCQSISKRHQRIAAPSPRASGSAIAYAGLLTSDRDGFTHVANLKTDPATISVELSDDFGHNRGLSLAFDYIDGILFRPV